jgi:hypothetical protein
MKMDPNTTLMQKIQAQWGAAIAGVCKTSSVPPAFIAALIANESEGNADAKRFEPLVAGNLAAVVCGKAAAFDVPGSRRALGAQDLLAYLKSAGGANNTDIIANAFIGLGDLATSWGLTQIMGFHALMWEVSLSLIWGAANAPGQLAFTLNMLAFCAQQNQIDLTMPDQVSASEFFTWWNCGRINGKTYDPMYVPNGLDRMRIYSQLGAASSAPTGIIQ